MLNKPVDYSVTQDRQTDVFQYTKNQRPDAIKNLNMFIEMKTIFYFNMQN